MQPASTHRSAPDAFWAIAQAFMLTLHALFGNPEDIAQAGPLTRQAHKLLASWLRVGEALMRRVLILEAAACIIHPPRAKTQRACRTKSAESFDPAAPESWRAPFSAGAAPQKHARHARKAQHARPLSPFGLAKRYEALIRAFNAPHAYATRLAKRLWRNAPACDAALKAPPEARHRIDQFAMLDAEARATIALRFDSG